MTGSGRSTLVLGVTFLVAALAPVPASTVTKWK